MRAGMLSAVVLLLAACAGAPQPSLTPGTPSAPATDPSRAPLPGSPAVMTPSPAPASKLPSPVAGAWRELATDLWLADDPFAARAATNASQLDELWQELGQDGAAPAVDFDQELVLFFGMSGSSSCPERLEALVVDIGEATVHGRWADHDPNVPCTDDLQAQGVLLAVPRTDLPQVPFMFSLRSEPICRECPDRPDQTLVDPAG